MKPDENPDPPEEPFIDEQVLEILRESLKKKLKRERVGSKNHIKSALKSTMQEFLTCGRLIGYDLDGDIVEIAFHSNKMEDNAMQNLLIQKFGEFLMTKGGNNL